MSFPLLSDILEFTRDGEWGKGEPADGLVKMGVIRGTDFSKIRRGDFSTIPVRYIPKKAADRKTLRPRDILFETAGGTKDQPTGRSVFLKREFFDEYPYPLTCASFSRFLRVGKGPITPEYLFWYLQFLWSERLIYQYHIQHTGVARFQYTQFASEQTIPVLESANQDAISGLLGALDDKIELNRRMSATLEEMAQALYRSWFVDFDPVHARALGQPPAHMDATTAALFPDSFGPGGLPKGWEMSTIGEVAETVGGATPKTKEPAFWDGPHRWATPRGLSKLGQPILFETDRTLTDAGLAKVSSGLSPAGTVLLSSRAPIGYVAIAQNPVAVNQGFIALRETDRISSVEAYFWVQSNLDAILANANGSTFQEISKKNFRPLPCVVAPDPVRSAFRDLAGTWFDRVAGLCAESANLAALRDTLLPRLMSGELRIREAEKQVEEVV